MSVTESKAKAVRKTSTKKVTDAGSRTTGAAPLSAFVVSPLNARTIPYSAESVESLAPTIRSVGLLQNLVAHALPDGQLAVASGGRRLTAMNLWRSQQFLTPEHPVAFKRVTEDMAALVSYIENAQRSDMHAAEQIASFGTLAAQGKTAEQIGAEAGYSTCHVQRMLKLENLAPSLLRLLADDQLTVEQCQVLCLEDNQERQVRVYESVKAQWPELPATMLKKQITDKEISVTDSRFLFVGREAYENAGGVVRGDLFQPAGRRRNGGRSAAGNPYGAEAEGDGAGNPGAGGLEVEHGQDDITLALRRWSGIPHDAQAGAGLHQ